MTPIRPPTPAEIAVFVEYRTRPSILIFPPHNRWKGRIIMDETIGGVVEHLAVLEWAKMTMLEDEEDEK